MSRLEGVNVSDAAAEHEHVLPPGSPVPSLGDRTDYIGDVPEAVLDVLFANVQQGIALLDQDLRLKYATPAVATLLDYEREDLRGAAVLDLLHPDDVEPALELLAGRTGLAGRGGGTQLRVCNSSGAFVPLEIHSSGGPPLAPADDVLVLTVELPGAGGTAIAALQQRVAFEDLLTRVASRFVHLPGHQLDEGIAAVLGDIGDFMRVDRAWVHLVDAGRGKAELTHEWVADGVTPRRDVRAVLPLSDLSRALPVLRGGEPVYVADVAAMPESWAAERAWLHSAGARSLLAVALSDRGRLLGFLGFETVKTTRTWADDDLSVLTSTAGLYAQAIARRGADERFTAAFEHAPLGMAVHGSDGRHLMVNAAYCALLGRTQEELLTLGVLEVVRAEHREALLEQHRRLIEGEVNKIALENSYLRPDGAEVWGRVHTAAVRGPDGALRYTITHLEDITDRRRHVLDLRSSEERFRTLVENSPSIVARFDDSGALVYLSPSAQDLMGRPVHELIGHELDDLDLPGEFAATWSQALDRVFGNAEVVDFELEVEMPGGRTWLQSRAVPEFGPDGRVAHALVLSTDITERKHNEADLAYRALHDPLTGLANRTLAIERLKRAIRTNVGPDSHVAVLFLDLDRFKVVNDSLGHRAGDELLIEVANRLRRCLRPSDTVARLGGDEFMIVLAGIVDREEARSVAERVRRSLSAAFLVAEQTVFTATSIGITYAADVSDDAEVLLRDADAAMYRAKDRGRDRYEIFDEELRVGVSERLRRESELRRAMEAGEMLVYFQPEVELRTSRCVGAEALVRWRHPTRGIITAGEFIELAEETGLILELGTWVLREACRQFGEIRDPETRGRFELRVNLAARQVAQPDVVEVVEEALRSAGVSPSEVCLEITETTLMADAEHAMRVLHRLKDLGVRLAIDDFGTGYSSMTYLKNFPVDVVKIDQSFVRGLGDDSGDTAIVAAVISLAQALGLSTVGEGIETENQLDALRLLGCDHGQGFLFSKAVHGDALRAMFSGRSMLLPTD